jgi:hypothetical protein
VSKIKKCVDVHTALDFLNTLHERHTVWNWKVYIYYCIITYRETTHMEKFMLLDGRSAVFP